MTTFQSDAFVGVSDAPWFWPVLWALAFVVVVGIVVACITDNGLWAIPALLALAAFVPVAIMNSIYRGEQEGQIATVVQSQLIEAGYNSAQYPSLSNAGSDGNGTTFVYAEGSEILKCELIAGPEHGVFKVVCF